LEHVVSAGNFDEFLHEAVTAEPGCDKGLNCEELYGLYISWCLLKGYAPQSGKALWHALSQKGITPGKNTLAMTGPAAADYIVSSAPSLV
jgi:hypothetical protein